jgi:hypothetical protein
MDREYLPGAGKSIAEYTGKEATGVWWPLRETYSVPETIAE